jgi:hypothetical protein
MDKTFEHDCEIVCSEFAKVYAKNLLNPSHKLYDGELFKLKGYYKNNSFKIEDCHNFKEIMSMAMSFNKLFRYPFITFQLKTYNIPFYNKPYYYVHVCRLFD